MAGEIVVGLSVATAIHLSVGFPDVPGGHVHTGLWATVWQFALSPQDVK